MSARVTAQLIARGFSLLPSIPVRDLWPDGLPLLLEPPRAKKPKAPGRKYPPAVQRLGSVMTIGTHDAGVRAVLVARAQGEVTPRKAVDSYRYGAKIDQRMGYAR